MRKKMTTLIISTLMITNMPTSFPYFFHIPSIHSSISIAVDRS